MSNLTKGIPAALAGLAIVALTGCATKGYVNKQIAANNVTTETRIAGVQTQAEAAQTRADEALAKATLAERLAAGTLDYREVSIHEARFDFDQYELTDDARAALDDMATRLSSYPRYVLEIRGFADATGPDRYNYMLGRERAESVERYLSTRHMVPPGRVAILSFGEEQPVADNESNDGRSQNRRVQVRLLDAQLKPGETPLASAE
ncbi:MAG: OmpA family protein [Candidatus Eiseniibacteriota bacterium]